MTSQLIWLDAFDYTFPDTEKALKDPNGLLAVGGDLNIPRLISAYQHGIFPWYSEGQPILWWTPNPRMVLLPEEVRINRTLRKLARKHPFKITVDDAFQSVIHFCSQPRNIEGELETGTWITEEMEEAYLNLHREGFAHSIEAWQDDTLVGGLYGVSLGKVFFGESMFSLVSGASKIAFATLAQQLQIWEYKIIDCQMHSKHLESFGANEIPRCDFESILDEAIPADLVAKWASDNRIHDSWKIKWNMPEFGFD